MICRLCLKDYTEVINIFDAIGIELNVATILGKYFWFEPKCDDPLSTAICNVCWQEVLRFHEFFLHVEEAHRLLTERFSIKTEDSKQQQQQQQQQEIVSKDEPLEEQPVEELEYHFNELLCDGETETGATTQEQRDVDGFNDDKFDGLADETFDGATFMEHILEEKYHVAEKIDTQKTKEPHRELRRSTRSNAKTNGKNNSTSVFEVQNTAHEVEADNSKNALKAKRRGRPKKSNLHECTPKTKILKPDRCEKSSTPNHNTSYEEKMCEIDEHILKFMHLTCDLCALEQSTFRQLRKHIENVHHCKGYAVCCSKKFYKRVHLADHIEKHLNPNRYKCDECDKVFADKQCMRNHMLLKHQPDDAKTYACENCPKKFAKPYLLEQHRVIHEERTHICDVCQRGFASPAMLSSHVKFVHGHYGTMCDICAKVIRGRAAFAKHQLEHTGVTLPKVQCDKCGSWHKDKYSLQKHKRRHNDDGSMHVCNICGKQSPNRSAMLSHKRYVHAAQRIFECGVCKKAFKKAINLKEHMTMHTGEVLYSCPHCPKTFNSNANMHSHRKKVHPKEFEQARKNRRENVQNMASSTKNPTDATQITSTTSEMSMPQMLTIKTANETHSILVTTDDDDTVKATDGSRSIIFTVS